jgi:hypothetical protein
MTPIKKLLRFSNRYFDAFSADIIFNGSVEYQDDDEGSI